MRAHVQVAVRFDSAAALTRGLRAFEAARYVGMFDASVCAIDGLELRVDREIEIEADCDAWPAFRDLALEAAEGVAMLRLEGLTVDDVRIAWQPRTDGKRSARRWEQGTATSGTPSGAMWLDRAREAMRARGIQVETPAQLDVLLIAAPSTPAVWKALLSTCGIGVADGKALTTALGRGEGPRTVLRRVDAAKAEAARAALSAAGADLDVGPSR